MAATAASGLYAVSLRYVRGLVKRVSFENAARLTAPISSPACRSGVEGGCGGEPNSDMAFWHHPLRIRSPAHRVPAHFQTQIGVGAQWSSKWRFTCPINVGCYLTRPSRRNEPASSAKPRSFLYLLAFSLEARLDQKKVNSHAVEPLACIAQSVDEPILLLYFPFSKVLVRGG